MGGHFWLETGSGGPKGGVPPKKISIFFPEIFCQLIDRKSQEFSATYIKLLGRERNRKKVRVILTSASRIELLFVQGLCLNFLVAH